MFSERTTAEGVVVVVARICTRERIHDGIVCIVAASVKGHLCHVKSSPRLRQPAGGQKKIRSTGLRSTGLRHSQRGQPGVVVRGRALVVHDASCVRSCARVILGGRGRRDTLDAPHPAVCVWGARGLMDKALDLLSRQRR